MTLLRGWEHHAQAQQRQTADAFLVVMRRQTGQQHRQACYPQPCYPITRPWLVQGADAAHSGGQAGSTAVTIDTRHRMCRGRCTPPHLAGPRG